jgi:exosortase
MRKLLEAGRPAQHHACFLLWMTLSFIVLRHLIGTLVTLSLHDDRYSHILVIPLISLGLIYLKRKAIFGQLRYSPVACALFLLVGIVTYWVAQNTSTSLDSNYRLSLVACAMISIWIAGFVLCYGTVSFRAAIFPLLFLLFIVPVPAVVLDKGVFVLQKGSADAAYALYRLLGVPVVWHGFNFELPGVEIEIAKECSGIRSCTALLITGVLTSHLFLRTGWRQVFLSLLTVPIAIFKNAVRIVTISWLGIYVDRGFLFGTLHHYGGIPFAFVALAIFGPTLLILQRTEAAQRIGKGKIQGPVARGAIRVV